jgi:hypothetical protein
MKPFLFLEKTTYSSRYSFVVYNYLNAGECPNYEPLQKKPDRQPQFVDDDINVDNEAIGQDVVVGVCE